MSDIEQLILDGLALNDFVSYTIAEGSLSMNPPAKKPEWISGADSDGEILGRPPKYQNRVIEFRLQVEPQATRDLADAKIAAVVDKLQEAEQNANGLALVWTPADSTLSVTFRCLAGEITDMPTDWQSGWLAKAPTIGVRLTCLPLGEGTEVLAGTVTSSDIMHVVTLSNVAGDVNGLGRAVFTDAASQSRRWICYGLESRWLPTSSAPSLIVDSTSMLTTGYAGVTATRSGAYSGATNNVISATLRTQVQAICGLGNLSHVGSFRPQLRFYASATTMAVRLTYQTLDGPFRSLSWKIPVVAGWNHVDLGLLSIPSTSLGTQRWTGRVEAYSTASGGETFQVDVACMVPAELFGRARGSYARSSGVITGDDMFPGITAGTALGGRVATVGGTWATSGATTDYVAADAPGSDETMSRSTTADSGAGRFAILGSTTYTETEVGATIKRTDLTASGSGDVLEQGVVARYVDASNYFTLAVRSYDDPLLAGVSATYDTYLRATSVVAGVSTHFDIVAGTGATAALRLTVFASGRFIGELLNSAGGVVATLSGTRSELATGGVLASGKNGMRDFSAVGAGVTRYYDDFYTATPAAEPIACYSGQSIEFRHNTTLREDATGTYAGPPPEYVGSRFFVPAAGGPGRQTRIAVMAKRNDVETASDDNIADSATVDVYVTPRFLAVPR